MNTLTERNSPKPWETWETWALKYLLINMGGRKMRVTVLSVIVTALAWTLVTLVLLAVLLTPLALIMMIIGG